MAVITGKAGSVSLTGSFPAAKIANIKNWSLTIDVGSGDTTAFGDTNTTAVMCLRDAKCTISGDLSTDAGQNTLITQLTSTGTLAPLVLRLVASTDATQGRYWYAAAAQLTNIGVSADVTGVDGFTASFNCSGGVKYPAS